MELILVNHLFCRDFGWGGDRFSRRTFTFRRGDV